MNQVRVQIQVRALLLAMALGTCLAQLDQRSAGGAEVPINSSLDSLLRSGSGDLSSVTGGSSQRSNDPTTTTQATTIYDARSHPNVQQSSQVAALSATNVPSTTTTSSEVASSSFAYKAAFQYVKPLHAPKCKHNNQTYSVGQRWNEDCEQVCECVLGEEPGSGGAQLAISACRPRCPGYKDAPGDGCSLRRSKSDECCLDWVCDTEGKLAPTTTTTVVNTEQGQLNVSTTEIKLSSVSSLPQTSLPASSLPETMQPTTTPTTSTGTSTSQRTTQAAFSPTAAPLSSLAASPTTLAPAEIAGRSAELFTTVLPGQLQRKKNSQLATTRQQAVTTAATTVTPPTTQSPQPTRRTAPTATATATSQSQASSGGNRSPKQVFNGPGGAQVLATQSPSSLPPPRSHSLITTTTSTTTTNQPLSGQFGLRNPSTGGSSLVADQSEARSPSVLFPSSVQPEPEVAPESSSSPSLEANPEEEDLCIEADLTANKVNQTWLEPCNQSCRCVFRSEPRDPGRDVRIQQTSNFNKNNPEQTEVRCGLPPHCVPLLSRLTPTPECPSPRLLVPQIGLDTCACPSVVCAPTSPGSPPRRAEPGPLSSGGQTQAPPAATAASTGSVVQPTTTVRPPVNEPAGCRPKQPGSSGRWLAVGETFNDECHSTCRCFEDGEIRCQQLACPNEPPTDVPCAEWTMEQNFVSNSTESKCCPQWVCKEPAPKFKRCKMMGKEFAHGAILPEEIQPKNPDCERVCNCNDGQWVCQPQCPHLSDSPPEDLNCPPGQAYRTTGDECCPKWLCPITEEYVLPEFSVEPLNSSAVEVTFVLPLFAVNRRGYSELNYTGIAESEAGEQPPENAIWNRRSKIRTHDGVFFSQSVKYQMSGLKPRYKYWFKLAVHFYDAAQPLDEPLESQIASVVMPSSQAGDSAASNLTPPQVSSSSTTARPTSTSSTTTSTTTAAPSSTTSSPTTLAPTRILQPIHHHHHHAPSGTSRPKLELANTASPIPSSTTTATSSTTETLMTNSPMQELELSNSSTTTTTTTTTTTSTTPTPTTPSVVPAVVDIIKPDFSSSPSSESTHNSNGNNHLSPCAKNYEHNQINTDNDPRQPLPWTDNISAQMNGPLQRYAWHLFGALLMMTLMFTIVLYLYLKKSLRVTAPITSQSAYDNPTFTKLVSYYANQPHVLLVDENNQNFNNDAILARQKNLEVDKSSPLNHHHHQHQVNDIHHHNGRQHLI